MKLARLLLIPVLALGLAACVAPKRKAPPARHASVSAADRKRAEDLYIKGVYAYAEGKTDTAIADWKLCLKHDPHHEKARQALKEARAKQAALKQLE